MSNPEDITARLRDVLRLAREPVGVRFIPSTEASTTLTAPYDGTTKTRYCQALMRASQGEKVLITKENITCPASAAAFGLLPLPEKLATGQMLHNMGLFATPAAGQAAMNGMTRLKQGEYQAVILSPLGGSEVEPDVVLVESKPEHLMWMALAGIFKTGERLHFNTAVFQATCVDATVIPFVTGRMNASLGCYGCRDATNIGDEECLIGVPYGHLAALVQNLEELARKAMVKARSKEAYRSFSRGDNA